MKPTYTMGHHPESFGHLFTQRMGPSQNMRHFLALFLVRRAPVSEPDAATSDRTAGLGPEMGWMRIPRLYERLPSLRDAAVKGRGNQIWGGAASVQSREIQEELPIFFDSSKT